MLIDSRLVFERVSAKLLFQMADGISDGRDAENSDGYRAFHSKVGNVVIDRPGKRIKAFRRIGPEKNDTGEHGAEIPAQQADNVA
ncbi:hypothetical protein SDC9_184074 [bioreactor metagenome]|uniref:Uncharacterized protein n=1 Tax=bioreactor metagenome TaxID=1076179 RepID=A0A645HC13_9ZZZZ